jgi:diguanylate cyclase (GGDEF)-like protein
MPQTHREKARQTADRIRERISEYRFFPKETERVVTISIGVSEFPSDASEPGTLIELADRALYQSKRSGRNRVTLANAKEPAPLQEAGDGE